MEEVSNMIITTMANEFVSCITEEDNDGDISSYLYKEIDGLHYYIHCCIDNTRRTEYNVIRTNYKIKDSKPRGHPKNGFYGFMKYCMGDSENKLHIEEKITNLTGVYPFQWYNRYEKGSKGYDKCFDLTQKIYDMIEKKCELPYGYKLEIICGTPYLRYNAPELVSITTKQFYATVKEILLDLQKLNNM